LAAGLAHEIRNPIAAMRLKAENALAGTDTERRDSALRSILDQIGRLDALLRDLLAMTQQKELRLEHVNLTRFLIGLVEAHRELAQAKGVRLEVGTVPDSGASHQFDIDQMHRALDNLVLNGIQNTPSAGSVTVDAITEDGMLRVRVSNTGADIPDSIRDRLFEPFVTTRADGTGLGLAIVREIAYAHGGDVHLVPTADRVTFEIELPWQPS
jgi:signal transduction histidine kinase